jgi:ABC-2 type transport system permease protein
VCLMVMFQVARHTRTEEETGRAELLRSTVLGRHAATLASMSYAVLNALLIGAITAGAMRISGLDMTGSLTYGAGLVLLGICYAAVALVAAQLSTSARGALGIAGAAIALGHLVRGVGAMQDNALVLLSPFGWGQLMNAFGDERWWPVIPLIAATAALLGLAGFLTAHRDFGSGILQPRRGHSRASPALTTSIGLALRLQRGPLIGWATGLFLLGLLYGAVIPTIPDLVKSNPDLGQFIGASADAEQALIDAFIRYILLFMAVVSTVRRVLDPAAALGGGVGAGPRPYSPPGCRGPLGSRPRCRCRTRLPGPRPADGIGLAVGYGAGMGAWDQGVAQLRRGGGGVGGLEVAGCSEVVGVDGLMSRADQAPTATGGSCSAGCVDKPSDRLIRS